MAEATHIILNPRGHLHRDGRMWLRHQREILRRLAPAEVTVARTFDEAADAAHRAALDGYRRIVAAGGGMAGHGVVNGLMRLVQTHRRQLQVGFLTLTRRDLWSRTLDLPRDLDRQLEVLSAGHTLPFDVGRVDCLDTEGRAISRYFLNGASFGLTSSLRREWRDPRYNLFRTLGRMAAAFRRTAGSAQHVRLTGEEDEELYAGGLMLGIVMGGRYYPTLGQVAPQANASDGRLELAWVPSGSPWGLACRLGGLLVAGGQSLPRHRWRSLERMTAHTDGGPVDLELDGVPFGRLPATFSVVRWAMPVLVERVAIRLGEPDRAAAKAARPGQLVGNMRNRVAPPATAAREALQTRAS